LSIAVNRRDIVAHQPLLFGAKDAAEGAPPHGRLRRGTWGSGRQPALCSDAWSSAAVIAYIMAAASS
jgi:hypothetical protein